MLKKEFIQNLSTNSGFSQANCEAFVDAFIKTVEDALVAGEKVQFVGFGNFEVVNRAARECRNPKTSEIVMVGSCKVPKFKASSKLKELFK